MKKLICIVCMLAFLLSACSVEEQAASFPEDDYTHGIYKLTFKTRMLSNDHVGNDWSFTYICNGQTIENGYTITQSLEIFTFRTIRVEIREKDKIDDIGTGVLRAAICDGGSDKAQITVAETDGRYKGNTAVWEVTCQIEMVCKS